MAISTIQTESEEERKGKHPGAALPDILTFLTALLFFGIGIWTRLYDLGLPFDRDGYDEGVYWQSLRSMASGYHLYRNIFYSQPPFFLLSIYPTYMLFGQTLWSARLGIALISLLGLLGAFVLGYTISGRVGGLAALLLLVLDPLYLQQSQTLQAEAPFVAFSLLAVASAYLWWKHPNGRLGMTYATFAGVTLALSIFCKLFGLATLVPIGLLFLAHVRRIWLQEPKTRLLASRSLLIGVTAFLLTCAALLLPFASSFSQLIQGVISFHSAASKVYQGTKTVNPSLLRHSLTSLLTLAAIYGAIVALLRRDWLVLPLLAWLGATVLLLWQQTPLFGHHLVALTAPLTSLAVIGIHPLPALKTFKLARSRLSACVILLAVLAVILVTVVDCLAVQGYYKSEAQQGSTVAVTHWDVNVERDLQRVTPPDQLVITDAQFLAARANRNIDPPLVDTSNVRVSTGYLTAQLLITEAAQPSVHAVLFYTGRLFRIKDITLFYMWLKQHFRLAQKYYEGKELWVKV